MEQNTKFDFNGPIEKTSTGLAKIVLDKINENKELIIYNAGDRSPEEKKKSDEAFLNMAISIVEIFATTDIPADYVGLPIDKAMVVLSALKQYLEGTVRSSEDEILSRLYGKKSPKSNTFAKDVVTLGEMMLKLSDVRKETGDKPEDYFINYKKSE